MEKQKETIVVSIRLTPEQVEKLDLLVKDMRKVMPDSSRSSVISAFISRRVSSGERDEITDAMTQRVISDVAHTLQLCRDKLNRVLPDAKKWYRELLDQSNYEKKMGKSYSRTVLELVESSLKESREQEARRCNQPSTDLTSAPKSGDKNASK